MTATAHAIVAGAIAAKFIGYPAEAMVLALSSHYIMDCVPHWDFGTNWRQRPKKMTGALAIFDTLLGFTVAYFLYGGKTEFLPLAMIVSSSLLPDWFETPWYIFFASQKKHEPEPRASIWERLSYVIYKIPNAFHTKAQFPFGLATQIATVAFFLILLK